jgi:uracil-DNA glycosylase
VDGRRQGRVLRRIAHRDHPDGILYPGRGHGGDLPPRRECAELWLDALLARLPEIELTLLIGQYAQRHYLGNRRKPTLARTVEAWAEYAPRYVPLPHPSPRNTPWFQRHPAFEQELVPRLRKRVRKLLGARNAAGADHAGMSRPR